MPQKFKILKASSVEPSVKEGDVVYSCSKPDYGLARDDTRMLGYECVSVTKNEDGDYPSFTIPRHDLEPIT